jgi:outer membrane protein
MPRTTSKILLTLLISVLPSLGSAAESAPVPAKAQPADPIQASAPTAATPAATLPAPAAKTAETPKPQQLRIGYIDIARVGAESSLGKASAAQVKQKQAKLQAQITAKRKQLDSQKKAIESQIAGMTPAQREAKAKEFQKKVESFQKFGMNAEKEMQTLQQGIGTSFNESIAQAATAYGKTNGLALVTIKREILYQSDSVDAEDVSEGVIKLMNEKWTKK